VVADIVTGTKPEIDIAGLGIERYLGGSNR
jgi:hypothetical protein